MDSRLLSAMKESRDWEHRERLKLEAEVARLREDHHALGKWPNCPTCVKWFRDDENAAVAYAALAADSDRLRAELEQMHELFGETRAECKRLRTIVEDAAGYASVLLAKLEAKP